MQRIHAAWLACAIALSLACEGSAPAQDRPPLDRTSARMASHFEDATRARDALVRGDLEGARRAARSMAREDVLPGVDPGRLVAIRDAAHRAAAADDVAGASRALAEVAVACGACHRAAGARIEAAEVAPPPGGDARARMQQHLWATDRLWEGLVLPDDERFAAGAAALASAALLPQVPSTAETVAPEARAIADRVRAVAREARSARDDAARARSYGALLGTCADCHRLVATGGPAAPVGI